MLKVCFAILPRKAPSVIENAHLHVFASPHLAVKHANNTQEMSWHYDPVSTDRIMTDRFLHSFCTPNINSTLIVFDEWILHILPRICYQVITESTVRF